MLKEEKINFIKENNLSKREILNYLIDDLVELNLNKKLSIKTILKLLEEKIGITYNYDVLARKIKEAKEEQITDDKIKIIAIVNFKGGVGKSTIANLIDIKDSIILNIDNTQDAKKINSIETYNYIDLLNEYGISSLEEIILGAKESGKKTIIIDTPGEINEIFLDILPEIDFFIVPFTIGDRSEEATISTIQTLNTILDDYENRKDKWCLVLNKYLLEEHLKELDLVFKESKKILGDRLVCKSSLKQSLVIPTIEKKKKTINELIKDNAIAYGAFKAKVKNLNKEIKSHIGVK